MKNLPGHNLSAAILAGGANKRFGGRIKAKELVGGRKIIDRTVDVLNDIFNEIILVTNTPDEFTGFNGIVTGDHFMGKGPLGGIHAAIKISPKEAVFIFAGDMPFLDKELIIRQIVFFERSGYDAVIPVVNGNTEPLHGIYRTSVMKNLEEFLSSQTNLAITDFLEGLNAGLLEMEGTPDVRRAFTNINTEREAIDASGIDS